MPEANKNTNGMTELIDKINLYLMAMGMDLRIAKETDTVESLRSELKKIKDQYIGMIVAGEKPIIPRPVEGYKSDYLQTPFTKEILGSPEYKEQLEERRKDRAMWAGEASPQPQASTAQRIIDASGIGGGVIDTSGLVKLGGYDTKVDEFGNMWNYSYDIDGKVIGRDYIGRVPAEGAGPAYHPEYQKYLGAQEAYEESKPVQDWQKWLAFQDRPEAAYEMYGAPMHPEFTSVGAPPVEPNMEWQIINGKYMQVPKGYEDPSMAFARQQAEAEAKYRQDVLLWEQQKYQMEQQRLRESELARLAANPSTWLQFATASGQAPRIQEWMLPLMPKQYSNRQAGQPIPGWQPYDMSQMPALIPTSMQYYNRMGPTAQQQLTGYTQARTGATPEEQQFRLWGNIPGGGLSLRRSR